ncbi:MAG: GNAT family N-acetyltransferase [Acidimicrobiales bacterium]
MVSFETERLRCGPWIEEARHSGVDLASVVAGMLTPAATVALPPAWHGVFTIERARAWIEDREADSTALLVTDRANRSPIGLAILAALPAGDTVPADTGDPDTGPFDLRIGYVIDEAWWGRGIATELVEGLVDLARSIPDIVSVTGGVDQKHEASIRVLERSGFRLVDHDDESSTYRVDVGTEWDTHASGWDNDPAAQAYATAAFASLEQLLQREARTLDGAAVLDFGCGTGLLTEHLTDAGATVHAVDTSTAMLDVLRSKHDLVASGRVITDVQLPASAKKFHIVVCSSVCAFLDDYPATVADLATRLEPGGLLVQWDWERTPGDEHGLTRDQIAGALHGAGLTEIEVVIGFDIESDGHRMAPLMGHGRRPHTPD